MASEDANVATADCSNTIEQTLNFGVVGTPVEADGAKAENGCAEHHLNGLINCGDVSNQSAVLIRPSPYFYICYLHCHWAPQRTVSQLLSDTVLHGTTSL